VAAPTNEHERVARAVGPMIVRRHYEPDPARMAAALLALLGPPPPPVEPGPPGAAAPTAPQGPPQGSTR
jgi:hypothetical protein